MLIEILKIVLSWIIPLLFSSIITYFSVRKKVNKDIQGALRDLLRSDILEYHDKYTTKGYCPLHAKITISSIYERYTNYGGNDVGTKLYNEIMELPESEVCIE